MKCADALRLDVLDATKKKGRDESQVETSIVRTATDSVRPTNRYSTNA